MAITVASDRTIINATGGDCESLTNWTATVNWDSVHVLDNDSYIQGSNAIGARCSAAAGPVEVVRWDHLTTTSSFDLTTGVHLYFWIKCISLPGMDTRERGGIGLSLSSDAAVALDTTAPWGTIPWEGLANSKQWYLTGSNFEGTSGWVCYVVDPTSTPDFAIGTAVMTSVDRIGIRAAATSVIGGGAFKPHNVLWDYIAYATKLTITGSTGTFQDIFALDSATASQFGILGKTNGVYLGGGKLVFGTTGQSAPCILTDTKQTLVWQDFRVASGFYEIQLVGNTTPNVTTVTLGAYSGGLTSGGCTIRGVGLDTRRLIKPVIVSGGTTYVVNDILTVVGGTFTTAAQFEVWAVSGGVITAIVMKTAGSYSVPPTGTLTVTDARNNSATFTATVAGGSIWTLTASAANQTLNIYGSTLSEMLSAALASTTVWRGNTITNSGTITANGTLIDNCIFQDLRTTTPISATYQVDAVTTVPTITNSKFVNCATALRWPIDSFDPNGKLDGTTFISGGTGHAIEFTGTATSRTLTNVTFTGYSGTSTNAAVFVNIATGNMTLTIAGTGTDITGNVRTAGATVTVVAGAVSVTITAKDVDGVNIQNARVLMLAAAGGPMPYAADTGSMALSIDSATAKITRASGSFITDGFAANSPVTMSGFTNGGNNTSKIISTVSALEVVFTSGTGLVTETGNGDERMQNTVTITRSGTTATVTHNAHGMANNDKVQIKGADQMDYNGVWSIQNVTANAYDYLLPDTGAGALTINVVASAGTFTRTTGSYLTDGFRAGNTITTSGFTGGNNATKVISTVTATVITVTDTTGLADETGNNNERVQNTPTTPATGTIKVTYAALSGLTDVNGQITMSRAFTSSQPISGKVRKSTATPFYKTSAIVGTISSTTGFSSTILLISDE